MKWSEAKKQLLSNPKFKKAYFKPSLGDIISDMLIEARARKGVTQKELADKLNTKQSSIARLEGGGMLPSLTFLKKIADVYNTELIAPKFSFMTDYEWEKYPMSNEASGNQTLLSPICLNEDPRETGYFILSSHGPSHKNLIFEAVIS